LIPLLHINFIFILSISSISFISAKAFGKVSSVEIYLISTPLTLASLISASSTIVSSGYNGSKFNSIFSLL
jgi:hypothetical protein